MLNSFANQFNYFLVPNDFYTTLENYTKQGFRVIALAHREVKASILKIEKLQREELEENLTFLGLIILENRLKEETVPALEILSEAGIRSVMITGMFCNHLML